MTKVILCCSETALKSWWVDKEFEIMVAKKEDYHARLLIPLALDNYLFEKSAKEWIIGEIRNKRQVQSFVTWQDRKVSIRRLRSQSRRCRTDGGNLPHANGN